MPEFFKEYLAGLAALQAEELHEWLQDEPACEQEMMDVLEDKNPSLVDTA